MKLAVRIITVFFVTFLLIVAVLLASLESWFPKAVRVFSPDYLSGALIDIQKIDIAWGEADIKLSGIELIQNKTRHARIGTLAIDFSRDKIISRLLNKELRVDGFVLEDVQLSLEEKQGAWGLQGLELTAAETASHLAGRATNQATGQVPDQIPVQVPDQEAQQSSRLPAPPTQDKEWQIIANSIQLNNIKMAVLAEQFASDVHISKFELDQFDSQSQEIDSNVKLAITLQNSHLNINQEKLLLSGSPSFTLNLNAKGQLKRPELRGSFAARDISVAIQSEAIQSGAAQSKAQASPQQIASISNFQLSEFYSNTLNQANSQVKHVALDKVQLLSEHNQQSIESISIENVEHHPADEQASIIVQGLAISGVKSRLHLLKDYQPAALIELNKILASLSQGTNTAPESESESEAIAESKPGNNNEASDNLRIAIENVQLDNSEILIHDSNFQPATEIPIEIKRLAIDQFNSADPESLSRWTLDARLEQQGIIHSKGMLKPLSKQLAMQTSLKLEHINLVNLSPYLEKQTGYFIHTGLLSLDSQSQLDGKQLQSKNKIDLRSIELERVAADKADQVDQNISMPLDSALGLLRNDQGDIELELPVNGDISSPAFGSGDILRQVSSRALREASVAYLKYAFQPYGTLITVGSWLNDQAQKIRLDALSFNNGQSELSPQQQAYLQKLGQLLQKKEQLRVRACPVLSQQEELWITEQLNQQKMQTAAKLAPPEGAIQTPPEKPTADVPATNTSTQLTFNNGSELAKARMSALKHFMQNNFAIGPDRLLSCKLQTDKESSLSYIHLEI